MKNMKPISRGFPPLTIIFISILLISSFLPCVSASETYLDGATFDGTYPLAYTIRIENDGSSMTPQFMHRIGVNDVDLIKPGISQFVTKMESSLVSVHTITDPYTAYGGDVRIDGDAGAIVGTTRYVHVHETGSYIWIIVVFESLNVDSYSGYHDLHIMDLKLDGLKSQHWAYYSTPSDANSMYLTYNAGRAFGSWHSLPENDSFITYDITKEFYSTVQLYDNSTGMYRVFIDRYGYQSKFNVSIYNGSAYEQFYEDTSFESNDTELYLPKIIVNSGDQIFVGAEDLTGDTYSAYLSTIPSPPPDDGVLNVLSGIVKDAKTNAVIPSNVINVTTRTGYGGSYTTSSLGDGTYSISRIIDDLYTIETTRTGYEDYAYEKNITKDTPHNIYLVQNITLDTNKSGIYGTVTNYYDALGVPDTWVKISNDTWYSITYTNQNGYYEFLNFAPGNYTLQAEKSGYFPYIASITGIADTLIYFPIELVSTEVPADPTATPEPPVTNILTPFNSIIQQFGISEEFGGALIALFIIVFMGAIFTRAGTMAAIMAMFFGFVATVFMGLLPAYLLSITIIVVVLLILHLRGDL